MSERFGPFTLVELIAVGGMAEVHLATDSRHPEWGQIVVKRMLPHLRGRGRYRKMFEAEGELATRLSHPNIVGGLDAGEIDGEAYLALEYVDGRTLLAVARSCWAREEAIPLSAVATVVHDINEALRTVHADGLVHRDVSPDNIMVDRDGLCRLLDFGIAKTSSEVRDGVTRTGELKGKVPYMSPEQVRGDELEAASDRYALGALTFFLLSSARPFERERDIDLLNAIVSEAPAPLVGFGDSLVKPLAPLVTKLIHKTPAKRPAPDIVASTTAPLLEGGREELARLVEAAEGFVLDGEKSRSTTRAVRLASVSGPRRFRSRAALVVPLVVLALVAGFVLWPREGPVDTPPKELVPEKENQFETRVLAPFKPSVDAGSPVTERPVRPVTSPPVTKPSVTKPPVTKRPIEPVQQLALEGASWVRWSLGTKTLGTGSLQVSVPKEATSVVARDTRVDLVSEVPIALGKARYADLPFGTVSIRALPYAEVSTGKRTLGTTPVGPLRFPVGTLTLTLKYGERTEVRKVSIHADRRSDVRVKF